jgi:hypothetical protein
MQDELFNKLVRMAKEHEATHVMLANITQTMQLMQQQQAADVRNYQTANAHFKQELHEIKITIHKLHQPEILSEQQSLLSALATQEDLQISIAARPAQRCCVFNQCYCWCHAQLHQSPLQFQHQHQHQYNRSNSVIYCNTICLSLSLYMRTLHVHCLIFFKLLI